MDVIFIKSLFKSMCVVYCSFRTKGIRKIRIKTLIKHENQKKSNKISRKYQTSSVVTVNKSCRVDDF